MCPLDKTMQLGLGRTKKQCARPGAGNASHAKPIRAGASESAAVVLVAQEAADRDVEHLGQLVQDALVVFALPVPEQRARKVITRSRYFLRTRERNSTGCRAIWLVNATGAYARDRRVRVLLWRPMTRQEERRSAKVQILVDAGVARCSSSRCLSGVVCMRWFSFTLTHSLVRIAAFQPANLSLLHRAPSRGGARLDLQLPQRQ